jgi:hypothetical protein
MAKAGIYILSAYNLNVDIDTIVSLYNAGTLNLQNHVINTYTELLKLLPDPQLSQAKSILRDAISIFTSAINFIVAEGDPQDDDLFIIETPEDEQEYRNLLTDLNNALDGTTYIRKFEQYVNLSQFFDYPKVLRNYLPTFRGMYFIQSGTFPDPTFGGIMPYMTANILHEKLREARLLVSPLGITDFDGDGKTDITVYRSSTGAWYVYPSGGSSPYGFGWGGDATDKPVPGDYDGDGKTDIAVYRASTGAWYVYPSGGGAPYGIGWGGDGSDKPVPGDYDGDGKTDIAVYRSSTGAWYVYPSGGGAPYGVGWGGDASDKPAPGDYDGDGKTDIAVYRASTGAWYVYPSGGSAPYGLGWGGDPSDLPVTTNLSSID